ncbi:MAG: MIP/aquaporin family protein [Pseudomonadota bacterium]
MIAPRPLAAEMLGTAFLLATIVGSGVMGDTLSGGLPGLALFPHAVAIGAMLFVLITLFGPISGAHFNPAVTMVFALRGEISPRLAIAFAAAQILGAVLGVWAAHLMFDLSILQVSGKLRSSAGQWSAEVIATFGLLMVILAGLRVRAEAVPALVGLYIMAALWFTASTSFANPAVTIARSMTDTFSGIEPAHVPAFLAAQIAGALLAWRLVPWLWPESASKD